MSERENLPDDAVYERLNTFPAIEGDTSWSCALHAFVLEFTQEQRDEVLEIFTKADKEMAGE